MLQNVEVVPGWPAIGQNTSWAWYSDKDGLPLSNIWI